MRVIWRYIIVVVEFIMSNVGLVRWLLCYDKLSYYIIYCLVAVINLLLHLINRGNFLQKCLHLEKKKCLNLCR